MKVFDNPPDSWGEKTNFVDRNNVVVGFSMSRGCCESFGYFLTKSEPDPAKGEPKDTVAEDELEPYSFDPDWSKPNLHPCSDAGASITFRLVADGLPHRYLTLYNHHNGYYSHGFTMQHGQTMLKEGSL